MSGHKHWDDEPYIAGTDFSRGRCIQIYGEETKMYMNNYWLEAKETAIYSHAYYPFASLMIEAAEFADLVTKEALRGDTQLPDKEFRKELVSEAGDVLWNLCAALGEYDIQLEEVAVFNLQKLADRAARGVLQGNGGSR
jgi:NTP pyrophosphatase (non-canonical NTP hydrolase)